MKAEPTQSIQNFQDVMQSQATPPVPVVTEAPMVSTAPMVSQTPVATPTSTRPLIHSHAKSSSVAASSSSATPSPSASAASGPLGNLVGGIPIVGGLVKGPLAGLGLRR
jgi:hypothetical protein